MKKGPKTTKKYMIQSQCLRLLIDVWFVAGFLFLAIYFHWPIVWLYVIGGLGLLDIAIRTVYPLIAYHFYTYRVSESMIEIRHNIWFKQYDAVKIERIQYLESVSNPLSKRHALKQLRVITAGHEIALPYLKVTETERIEQHCMSHLVRGEDDV